MLVGSNLEFLRVGRPLELEDIDHGGRRPARIDRVDVEVDRDSKVPQLIVTLRYDDDRGMASQPNVSFDSTSSNAPSACSSSETTAPRSPAHSANDEAGASPSCEMDDDDLDAARRMRSNWSGAATAWAPAISRLSTQAKTTLSLLWAKAFERSGAVASLRRTTSPPPSGALHTSGKRVVRAGSTPELDIPVRRGPSKKAMLALGGASGLVVVIGAVALAKPSSPSSVAATASPSSSATTTAQLLDPAVASDTLTANVPLFGPTALGASSAQPAMPSQPGQPVQGLAGAGVAGAAAAPNPASQPSRFAAASPANKDEANERAAASQDDGDDRTHKKVQAFVHGKVTHPLTFRLKTDGEVTALHGARTPTGFTVAVPGRKAVESLQALAARDHRIASVHVNNGAKGTEISVQFKDGVPPYAIRAKGSDIQIALGRAEEGEKSEHADHPDHPEHGDRAERSDRVEHADRAEHADRSDHSDRSERGDRAERKARAPEITASERSLRIR